MTQTETQRELNASYRLNDALAEIIRLMKSITAADKEIELLKNQNVKP